MKAIIGFVVMLTLCLTVQQGAAQTLILEWERTLSFENDSLNGLTAHGIAEDPHSHKLYVFGEAQSRHPGEFPYDSSDAWAACLTPEGDSLWSKLIDGPYVQSFEQAAFYPNGDILFAGNALRHFLTDSLGELIRGRNFGTGRIGWATWDLDLLPDGRILTATEIFDNEGFHSGLFCTSAEGDSLWSLEFHDGSSTYVRAVQPLPSGQLLVWQTQDFASNRFLVDQSGTIIDTFQGELLYVLFYPDGTQVGLGYLGNHSYSLQRRDIANNLINEFTTVVNPNFLGIIPAVTEGYLVYGFDGWIKKYSQSGELQLSDSTENYVDQIVPLRDGYLAIANAYDDETNTYRVMIRKYSVEIPYLLSHDDTLDFGVVEPGAHTELNIDLTNAGPDSIRIDTIVASPALPIAVDSPEEYPYWISHRELAASAVTFAPTSPVLYEGELLIFNNTAISPLHVLVRGDARISAVGQKEAAASDYALLSPYPNPFNPSTTLSFQLPKESDVVLTVFDIRGRLVREVVRERMGAGTHSVNWSCPDCASGLYFAKLDAGVFSATQKLLLLK